MGTWEKQLKTFMNDFNNFKSNLKLTYEYSKNEIKFEKGSLVTSVYIKPTDRHQYLHYRSSHLNHIKRSIIYSQVLRNFPDHTHKMKPWFGKQGYLQNMKNKTSNI